MTNMLYSSKLLHGGQLSDHHPILSGKDGIHFEGAHLGKRSVFGLDDGVLSGHVLCMGGTGTGKTNFFKHCVRQIKAGMTPDDVMIIFDTKGDFHSDFFDPAKDLCIGNSGHFRSVSEKWNLFREVVIDGYEDETVTVNARELSKAFFSERESRSNNPFFPNAAGDLLAGIITTIVRLKAKGDLKRERMTNKALRSDLDTFTPQDLIDLLSLYPDMTSKSAYIRGDNAQSQGVLSELYSVINDLLVGVFNASGSFSVRNFVRRRGARALFIEYDMACGEVLTPVYSALFDLALKEAMSRSDRQRKGSIYLILDELKLLPDLKHLEDGINFGRSQGLKIIAGLQSVDQLKSVYHHEAAAANILSGFSSLIAFRANDAKTRNYIRDRFGENTIIEQYQGMDGMFKETLRHGHTVEDWDLIRLSVGEAVIGTLGRPPFQFRFDIFKK